MIDIFNNNAFQLRTLTDTINKRPFVPGRIGQMGLFSENGINTLTAQIEEKEGVLYLVPTAQRGAPATRNKREGRKLRPLNVVHMPVEDRLMADEVQGVREFGSENQLQTIQTKLNEIMDTAVQSFEATFEFMRVGAVKGVVLDADGESVLYDLFDLFEIDQDATTSFKLDEDNTATNGIRRVCSGIIRSTEDDLGATPLSYVHGLCGSEFLDEITANAETREAWKRWEEGLALRQQVARRTFSYGGILFEEYRGSVGNVQFFESDEVRFFPVGVPGLFRKVYGPANFMETVNTIGLPMYAKTVIDPAQRWVDVLMQSNPLPYCTRPKVLKQGVAGTSA